MGAESRHSWRVHLGLFVAEVICVSAFVVEISRALSGNALSWAYVVEWPVLGVYAIYMWRKLLKDEEFPVLDPSSSDARDEVRLAAWNDYLERAHAHDLTKKPPP